MIIAITTFKLAQPITRQEAAAIFRSTAPKYLDVPGLVQKRYIFSEDGTTVGGIYMWRSKADAEAKYTPAWREFVRGKYGSEPLVTYFDSPVLVDNVAEKIVFED